MLHGFILTPFIVSLFLLRYKYITLMQELNVSQRMNAIKSCQAISHVNAELKKSETVQGHRQSPKRRF
jgi:hypothetical protein